MAMDPVIAAAIGGGAINATGGIFSQWMANRQTRRNNEQNEALMRESWSRDDTAVQRSADDFEAAGLSRTLAAGNSASNSGPIQLEAEGSRNVGADAMAGAAAAVNIAQTKKQNDLVKAQINKINADKMTVDLQNDYLRDTLEARKSGTISEMSVQVSTAADRIKQMGLESVSKQIGVEQAQLNTQASRKQIERHELEIAIGKIEKAVKEKYAMDEAEARLLALKLGNEITSYNANWYKGINYPISSSGSADLLTKGVGLLNIMGGGNADQSIEPMAMDWWQKLMELLGIRTPVHEGPKQTGSSGRSH